MEERGRQEKNVKRSKRGEGERRWRDKRGRDVRYEKVWKRGEIREMTKRENYERLKDINRER